MMKIYKLTIRPLTSFRTPLQSDTIFGHLLWALRYTESEDALVDFLARCRAGDPPLLVSAGFPSDTLPVPVLPSVQSNDREEGKLKCSLADKVVEDILRKAREEERYLPLKQWREIAGRLSADALDEARREASERLRQLREIEQEHLVTRTTVDRITGSAREGQLFVVEEVFYGADWTFDVWHKLDNGDDTLLERVAEWWRWIERNGFGKRKSTGHGMFRIEGEGLVEASGELPQVENPNGFITLSAWVPRPGDPTDVIILRTRVKRGKLAEALALPSPWKKPLLMLEPGAVARLSDGEIVHEWYGGLVEDMHWTERGIVQYGYAFPVGVRISEV